MDKAGGKGSTRDLLFGFLCFASCLGVILVFQGYMCMGVGSAGECKGGGKGG